MILHFNPVNLDLEKNGIHVCFYSNCMFYLHLDVLDLICLHVHVVYCTYTYNTHTYIVYNTS